jgi:hypothetical protein
MALRVLQKVRESCLQNVDVDVILRQVNVSEEKNDVIKRGQTQIKIQYLTTEPRMNIDVTDSK